MIYILRFPTNGKEKSILIFGYQRTQYRAYLIMASFHITMTGSCRFCEGFLLLRLSLRTVPVTGLLLLLREYRSV